MELKDGKIITTTEVDLTKYLESKNREVEFINRQIASLQEQLATVLADLSSLVPKQE